jgi:hypothetical protein
MYVYKCLQAQYLELIILNTLKMFEGKKGEEEEEKNWIAEN